jgi:UDP-N-acetylglucosamine--N-acetylmuramyl-(pentapeptide) pyrophosphoryl-undecaprenol N-acetylglucosamine transferase
MRVCVVASHSGGHILPAVAFCQGLKDKYSNVQIDFITTDGKIERQILKDSLSTIFFKKKKISLLTSYNLLGLFFQAQNLVKRLRPDLIAGFGGYLSIPFIACANFYKIPNFIHEQNVRLGLANWFLLRFTDKIIFSFPSSQISDKIKTKALALGLPLRKEIKNIDKNQAREFFGLNPEQFTILVMGGSQGSYKINTQILEVLKEKDIAPLQIIHLTGSFKYDSFVKDYKKLDIKYRLFDFFERMDYAFSAADLVISRAGANTIAELITMQLPSILIPYPYAKLHQLDNARFLTDKGAAILIEDKLLCKNALKGLIRDLTHNPERLGKMKEALKAIKMPDARNRMADLAGELIHAKN